MGGSRPEGSSGIGPGGQAAVSLTPDFNGTTSDFLLDSFYLSSLKNDLLSEMTYMIALDCIMNGCCNLCQLFYTRVLSL